MDKASPSQRRSLTNVLAATDFSSASFTALQYALSIVRQFAGTLYLAHIVSDIAAADHAWRDGQRLTTDLLISGELRGVPHKLLVGHGEIWEGLAPMVRENNIDMIVVGTHGRMGLAKVLLGSVAERIFRQASCPVLTVGPNSPSRSRLCVLARPAISSPPDAAACDRGRAVGFEHAEYDVASSSGTVDEDRSVRCSAAK